MEEIMTNKTYVIAAIVFLLLVVIFIYNGFISKKNRVNTAFSSIDIMLKKRYDLIPGLVSAVKTYMKHEADTLKNITALRAQATSGQISDNKKVELDNQISKAIGGIMVAVENYPDLKASQNFVQLQASLNEIEEQISAARRAYNAAVLDYNNAREMFPTSIVAKLMGLKERALFEIQATERLNVNVGSMFDA